MTNDSFFAMCCVHVESGAYTLMKIKLCVGCD